MTELDTLNYPAYLSVMFLLERFRDAKIPDPPKGHKWKRVQHDNTVSKYYNSLKVTT